MAGWPNGKSLRPSLKRPWRRSENEPKRTAERAETLKRRKLLQDKGVPDERIPPRYAGFTPSDYGLERIARKSLERLVWELDRFEPIAMSVYDGRTPDMKAVTAPLRMPLKEAAGELEATCILAGGDPFSPTKPVTPATLSVIKEPRVSIPSSPTGRRTALALWISDPRNPLATRSIVNRVWMWHFGMAIAENPNNFGSTGKPPTNPELLDWLAAEMVEHHGSFKALHRLIMASDAYCRGAALADPSTKLGRDELERTYAVFRPRRLTAEELRDAMLSVSGELNTEVGGIPNRPEINREVAMQPRQVMGTFASAWVPNPLPRQRHRRSLYALKLRGLRDPFMEVFNEPAPDFSCERRDVSTVTPQVFSLFNSQASYDRALAVAARLQRTEKSQDAARRPFVRVGLRPTGHERRSTLVRRAPQDDGRTAETAQLSTNRPFP